MLYVREPSSTSGARYHSVTTCSTSQIREQGKALCVVVKTDLVTEGVYWHAESSGQSEITNLELASSVDEQILGLEITVQYAVLVTECDTLYDQFKFTMRQVSIELYSR